MQGAYEHKCSETKGADGCGCQCVWEREHEHRDVFCKNPFEVNWFKKRCSMMNVLLD